LPGGWRWDQAASSSGRFQSSSAVCYLGRYQEALAEFERTIELDPRYAAAHVSRAWELALLGRADEAERAERRAEELIEVSENLRVEVAYAIAVARGQVGEADSLRQRIPAMARHPDTDPDHRRGLLSSAIMVLARGSEPAAALDLLGEFEQVVGKAPDHDWLIASPDFARFRGDPRFAALLESSRADFLERMKPLVEARAQGKLPPWLEAPLDASLRDSR